MRDDEEEREKKRTGASGEGELREGWCSRLNSVFPTLDSHLSLLTHAHTHTHTHTL